MNEAVLHMTEPDDQVEGPVPTWEPPPRRGRHPLVVVVVVLFAIGLITFGLVAANGDDFAKARIPERVRLPVAGRGDAAAVSEALGTPGRDGPLGVPYFSRKVEVPVPLVDPGPEAVAYELRAIGLSRAARARVSDLGRVLGVNGEVVSSNGVHVIVEGDRRLAVQTGGDSAFNLIVGPVGCKNIAPGDCAVESPFFGSEPGVITSDGPGNAPEVTASPATPSFGPARRRPTDRPDGASATDGGPGVVDLPVGAVEKEGLKQLDPATKPVAQIVAGRVIKALGREARFEVEDAGEVWGVRIRFLVAGQTVEGYEAWIGVSPTGEVRYANGSLGVPEMLASYPLVGVDAGIERLRQGWTGAFPGGSVMPAVDPGSPTMLNPTPGTADAPCGPGADCGGTIVPEELQQCKAQPDGREICEPAGGTVPPPPDFDPSIPPEPPDLPTVVVTGVRLGLQLAGDHRGSFLVPAYVFVTKGEGEITVPAVRDADIGSPFTAIPQPLQGGRSGGSVGGG